MKTIQVASPKEITKEFRQGHALFVVCFQLTMEPALTDALTENKQ